MSYIHGWLVFGHDSPARGELRLKFFSSLFGFISSFRSFNEFGCHVEDFQAIAQRLRRMNEGGGNCLRFVVGVADEDGYGF